VVREPAVRDQVEARIAATQCSQERVTTVARAVVDDHDPAHHAELLLLGQRQQHELQVPGRRSVHRHDGETGIAVERDAACARSPRCRAIAHPWSVRCSRWRRAALMRSHDTGGLTLVSRLCTVAGEHVRILFVCSANQCRSPLAEVTLAARASERSLPVTVSSAGVQAVPGVGATPPTIDAARRLGLDLAGHESAALAHDAVRAADLVVGLERRHVQEVVLLEPVAFTKTFTLKELVRRGDAVGPRGADEPVAEWLARLHQGRRPMDQLGASADDDVTDPTRSPAVDHRTTAEEIDRLGTEVLDLLFPARL
jgi:protein-tyrosine phosphatase